MLAQATEMELPYATSVQRGEGVKKYPHFVDMMGGQKKEGVKKSTRYC